MSDLRWSDCDQLAHTDPIGCLLCRTSKLNDAAHETDNRLVHLEANVTRWGLVTAGAALTGFAFQLFKLIHG